MWKTCLMKLFLKRFCEALPALYLNYGARSSRLLERPEVSFPSHRPLFDTQSSYSFASRPLL